MTELIARPKLNDPEYLVIQLGIGNHPGDAHLRIDPADHWGQRAINILGVGLPVRNAHDARVLGEALLLAASIIDEETK